MVVSPGQERVVALDPLPFTIGRRHSHPLFLNLPEISRDHARIAAGADGYYLSDIGSTNGIFVNGALVTSHRLAPGDRIEFPNCAGVHIVFEPAAAEGASLFLTHIHQMEETASSEFERVRLLLDFSHRVQGADVLGEVLSSTLEMALRLTGADGAFVWLRGGDGRLALACGRDPAGAAEPDPARISPARLEEAGHCRSAYLQWPSPTGGEIYGIPLPEPRMQALSGVVTALPAVILGVLALVVPPGQAAAGLKRELLHMLAGEVAQLVSRAQQIRHQEEAHTYEQEMALAAEIQQALMASSLPELPFAQVRGHSRACKQIGGDFFDAVARPGGAELAVVLADVSGKGASAALLASSLQGLVHAQLLAGAPLADIAATANRFILQRLHGEKYATLVIVRIARDGGMEWLNCGHPPPLLLLPSAPGERGGARCVALEAHDMPVGLLPAADYSAHRRGLDRGARLLLVTDGATEAQNPKGEMFGEARLEALASQLAGLEQIAAAVNYFTGGAPLADDCTLVDITYRGAGLL